MTDEPSGGDRPPFWFPVFWSDDWLRLHSTRFNVAEDTDDTEEVE